jgi:hypothetical protein
MARDNSPAERQKKQLERKLGQRASYDRILIVSEGSKTEPNYLNEIRAYYRLPTTNIVVRPSELGTEPIQVAQYAKYIFETGDRYRRIQPRAFEQVYVVFDRDDHQTYFEALKFAERLDGNLRNDNKQSVRFKAVVSVPCFELWLLLHFENVQSALHRDEVVQRLKEKIPGYRKGMSQLLDLTQTHLAIATLRATKLSEKYSAYSAPEPFTAFHELVGLLANLENSQN